MAIDPDTDAVVRTIYGEAGNEPVDGQQAVAAVIANRSRANKQGYGDVVHAPGQFSAWNDPKLRQQMVALSQDDPRYQAILSNIAPVLAAVHTPTQADSYYAPSGMPNGQPPAWANGNASQQIGSQVFLNQKEPVATGAPGPSDADVDGMVTGEPASAPATPHLADADIDHLIANGAAPAPASATPGAAAGVDPNVVYAETGDAVTKEQGKGIEAYAATHGISSPGMGIPGTADLPYAMHDASDVPPKGAYYFDLHGHLHSPDIPAVIGAGIVQGVKDVGNSLTGPLYKVSDAYNNWAPTHLPMPAAARNALVGDHMGADQVAEQQQSTANYNQLYAGAPYAIGGRIAGNVAASVPLMAGADAAFARLAAKTAGIPALNGLSEFLAGNAGRENMLLRGGSLAARGATQGAEGAALTSSASDRPLSQQVAMGATTGGLLHTVVPAVGAVLGTTFNRLTGAGATPEVAQLADAAMNKFGIPLRASQIAGVADRNAAVNDSQLISAPGSGYAANAAKQSQAFTRAVSHTIGEDTPSITPEVMQTAKSRIGSVFNDVADRTNITVDDRLLQDLAQVGSQAREIGLDSGQINAVDNQIAKITDYAKKNGGVLPGDVYQTITGKGSSLSKIQTGGQGALRDLAGDIRDGLDSAMQRSAVSEDVQALQQARGQYKNLKTIEDLAEQATPDGQISPVKLLGRVRAKYDNYAYGGGGDLGTLARIGQTFMKEPPNSGTAARLSNIFGKFSLGAAGAGEMGAMFLHDPVLAAKIGATAVGVGALRYGGNMLSGAVNDNPMARNALLNPSAGPSLAQRYLMAPPVQTGLSVLNNAYVPATVIGANRLQRAQ